MAQSRQRDATETAATLATWLAQIHRFEDVQVGNLSLPPATGFSNETILFDARYRQAGIDHRRELVARIAPSTYQVFLEDTFMRQHAIMRALAECTDVPIPAIHWLEPDTRWFGQPFWIMDRVRGESAPDTPPYSAAGWLHDAAPAQQAQAWWSGIDALVRVHHVVVDDLGLPAGCLPAATDTLGWHLEHQERSLQWCEDGTPFPLARQALKVLGDSRPPKPAAGPGLVWGDARLSNLIYRDFRVAAVLDWEMAGVGDPLMDLAWWLFCDDTLSRGGGNRRLPGFPSASETAAYWSSATGRSVEALSYYEIFAALRFTVVMLRIGNLLAQMGAVPAEFARDNHISRALAEHLARW